MNIHDESGWLVHADTENTVDITESDLEALLQLADSDDNWVESVKNETCYYDKHPSGTGIDILRNYIRTMNAGGDDCAVSVRICMHISKSKAFVSWGASRLSSF